MGNFKDLGQCRKQGKRQRMSPRRTGQGPVRIQGTLFKYPVTCKRDETGQRAGPWICSRCREPLVKGILGTFLGIFVAAKAHTIETCPGPKTEES